MTEHQQVFWKLVTEAHRQLRRLDIDARPSMQRVYEYIVAHENARDEFVSCFGELLRGGSPWEVAHYCMRRLRWPEVYVEAKRLSDLDTEWRIRTELSHVLEAWDDEIDDPY